MYIDSLEMYFPIYLPRMYCEAVKIILIGRLSETNDLLNSAKWEILDETCWDGLCW